MTDWYEITSDAFESFWLGLLSFLPNLVGALLVLVIGWFVAIAVGKIVSGLLYKLKFNSFFESKKWKEAMDEAEVKVNPSDFIGSLIKWILIIVVIWFTVDILGLKGIASFMEEVVAYLPNVIVAAIIFIVAVMIADFLSKIVTASVDKAGFSYAKLTGAIVKGAIWVFAIFAILIELGIAEDMILAIFYGLVALITIAGGLSFGLGGRDMAAGVIEEIRKNIK